MVAYALMVGNDKYCCKARPEHQGYRYLIAGHRGILHHVDSLSYTALLFSHFVYFKYQYRFQLLQRGTFNSGQPYEI